MTLEETLAQLGIRAEDALEAKNFVQSPVWKWFKARLERHQKRLIIEVASDTLTGDARLIRIGRLKEITEWLEEPEKMVLKLLNLEQRLFSGVGQEITPKGLSSVQLGLL